MQCIRDRPRDRRLRLNLVENFAKVLVRHAVPCRDSGEVIIGAGYVGGSGRAVCPRASTRLGQSRYPLDARRTKAAEIYKKTRNLRAVQLLLAYTKLESTVRYLGIEVALSISEQVEL